MNRTPMSQSYVNSQAGGSSRQQAPGASSMSQDQQQAGSNGANNNNNSNSNESESSNSNSNSNNNGQQQQTMNMMIGSSGEQMSQMTSLLLEFAFSAFVNKPQDIVEYAAQYFDQLRSQRGGVVDNQAHQQAHQHQQQQQQQQQQHQRSDSLSGAGGGGGGGGGTKRASSDSQRSNFSQNSFTNEAGGNGQQAATTTTTTTTYGQASEDEFELYDQNPTDLANQQQQQQLTNHDSTNAYKPKTSYNRRKSVFAEAYDPAADQEDDENNRIVHGKTDEQRQRLAKAIKSIFLFRSVDPQDMTQILDAMFEVKVLPGDVVIRQGDDGDNFYVVERGKFQIYYTTDDGQRQVRGEYEDNGFFGELALMYNQPRAATVVAMSTGSLWAMDRKTFRRIVLKSAFKKRKEYEALFEKVGILQCLNGYERMNLCDALESKRFLNGQMIIVQGDQANGMYFIESGNVKIVKQMDDGRVIDVAILGKGDYFGELALINHKPRAASVYAMGDDVKLAFLDVKAFERLLGSCIERMEKNCAMYLSELAHQEGRQNV